jgi:hypothetical protein
MLDFVLTLADITLVIFYIIMPFIVLPLILLTFLRSLYKTDGFTDNIKVRRLFIYVMPFYTAVILLLLFK